jgi:argininosuccinate lyase
VGGLIPLQKLAHGTMTGSDDESGSEAADTADDTDVVRGERFSGGPAREFLSSLAADRRIFAADLAVDRAHVVMLAEQAILDDETAGEVLGALDEIEAAGHDELPDGEDVHAAIETAVIDRVGEAGGRMHTARSRNDEVATCLRYRLREELLDILETTIETRAALLEAAEKNVDVVMPGFTHLQPAQPITVGFWLSSYEQALARDTERLLSAYDRVNRSPLGAAAFAGTTFDIDRDRTAELLGFDTVIENAMDAASTRDFLLESVGVLATLSITCSGLAEDGILFANRGFLDLDDEYASTSSIMPQKKNPDTLELARACAGDVTGAYSGLATTLKGLPRAYNRDLQRATGHLWEAVDAAQDAVDVATGAIVTAEWDEAALERAAGEGFSTATGVADLLARSGIPFRTAHRIVARAAEETSGSRGDREQLLTALDTAGEAVTGQPVTESVDRQQLSDTLDPVTNVTGRNSAGGSAPGAVREALDRALKRLERDREWIGERRQTTEAAHETLTAAVETYR